MSDEQETIAQEPAVEQPAITEQEEPVKVEDESLAEPEGEQAPEEGAEPQPEAEAEELETVELDGKQYQVPKALKAGIMMQADYTRKTQEVAEQRRELESRSQQVAQQAQAGEEEIKARAKLYSVNEAIQNYSQVDWDQLEANDPVGALSHWRKYQTLQNKQQQIQSGLSALGEQRSQLAKQEAAKRIEETFRYAQKEIKGWTPELDQKMTQFAVKDLGFDLELLGNNTNPQVYKALYLAYLGQQTLSKPARPPAQATQATPLRTVGAKASPAASKSLSEMSMDEYVAYRSRKG